MQPNTFVKRIQGHELEFNRQYQPLRYDVSIKDLNQRGVSVSLSKDEKGIWTVSKDNNIPVWLDEISLDIHYAIEKNEASSNGDELTDTTTSDVSIKRGAPAFPITLSCLY
ncbi:MAG TPA: hypothetical protein VF540_07665 [Segetibacter sp.]|jgi:hypothetical protein